MKKCPRCHLMKMHDDDALNALSRRDNRIYICSTCGDDEGFIDNGYMQPDELELAFVAKIGKKS